MRRIRLYWNTIRFLRFQQIVYQIMHRLRSKPVLSIPARIPPVYFLAVPAPDKPQSVRGQYFIFLNRTVHFPDVVDWEYDGFGKLWQYNLNYFDFLNQPAMSRESGMDLIHQFIRRTDRITAGLDPYPTSLRLINWVRFLSRHRVNDPSVHAHLRGQIDLLKNRLEYHLLGNHLLENALALFVGALYFRDRRIYKPAVRLLKKQLDEQILADGGHEERSPMYHGILLDRLLDVCLMVPEGGPFTEASVRDFLYRKAGRMLAWMEAVTFRNGEWPPVNDAAGGIAPTTGQIRVKAVSAGIATVEHPLSDSGYRMFRTPFLEVFMDVGPVGPAHQPGHAHADTFSFILYAGNQPLIVDAGTSTYDPGDRRQWERSTAAHNTVQVAGADSSEVWGSFRVAGRAKVTLLEDTSCRLAARHDGYRRYGIDHERSWHLPDSRTLVISDRLVGRPGVPGVARLHFHPAVKVTKNDRGLTAGPLQITGMNVSMEQVSVGSYDYAESFHRLRPAFRVEISFTDLLIMTITVPE
ncbi:heparinase II/III family protein [Larkinella soli]|uniref:heparinase II/III family protein n=1 Tax=Larkinella soli TaxID=1770527 RepID=UPI000FFB728B|nr:heparinase II/III-family protein [Larkinella soli]